MCIIQAAANWVTFTTLGGSKAEHRARKSPRGPDASGARLQGYTRTGRDGWMPYKLGLSVFACTWCAAHSNAYERPIPGSTHPLLPPFTFVFVLSVFFFLLLVLTRAPARIPARVKDVLGFDAQTTSRPITSLHWIIAMQIMLPCSENCMKPSRTTTVQITFYIKTISNLATPVSGHLIQSMPGRFKWEIWQVFF
jgi:hypothetical protein